MLNYNDPDLVLTDTDISGAIQWQSPSNIALIKYWGKHGVQLPRNPSISFTLDSCFTQTILQYEQKESPSDDISLDFYFMNEKNDTFGAKTKAFLDGIVDIYPFLKQLHFKINTANSFPHSTGIASSAAGMSALSLCLCSLEDKLFGSLSDGAAFDQKASYLSRLGSGSACRSIYGHLAAWGKTADIEGSSDEYAVAYEGVHEVYKTFCDSILIASSEEKSVSSRAGHALMEGNPFAAPRYAQANQRMSTLLGTLKNGDLETFGRIVEDEALTLHALMMASDPSFILMKPNTLRMIELIRDYRARTKNPVYFTLDAGPNIHLLYPNDIAYEVQVFINEQMIPLCQDGNWIKDMVGEGPVEL